LKRNLCRYNEVIRANLGDDNSMYYDEKVRTQLAHSLGKITRRRFKKLYIYFFFPARSPRKKSCGVQT
jgi:hypothetical protein